MISNLEMEPLYLTERFYSTCKESTYEVQKNMVTKVEFLGLETVL